MRTISSFLLLAVSFAALQGPLVSSPAVAQESGSTTPQLTCEALEQTPIVLPVSVDETDNIHRTLALAANTIQDHFSKCGNKPVKAIIQLKNGNHELPPNFSFHSPNGSITLEPAPGADQVMLTLPDTRSALSVESINLTIRNMKIAYSGTLFDANSNITLQDVILNGKGGVAITGGANLSRNHSIVLNRVTAYDTSLVDLKGRPAHVAISAAQVQVDTPLTMPVVNLPTTQADTQGPLNRVRIDDLSVISNVNNKSQPAVHIGRPNVHITRLVDSDQTPNATAITLANPKTNGLPLADIVIQASEFTLDNALIDLSEKAAPISMKDEIGAGQQTKDQ